MSGQARPGGIGARAARGLALAAALASPLAAGQLGCRGHAGGPKPTLGDEGGANGPAARLEDLKGSLVSVAVEGLPPERNSTAVSALRSETGASYDRKQVAADVRALWGLGSITDVRAEARLAAGGVALRFHVVEQPRIRSVDVRGSTVVPAAQWVAQMPVKTGDFADPGRLGAIRVGMQAQLFQAGYATAKVTWTATDTKGSGVDVLFEVTEGKMISLGTLEFRGNKVLSRKVLTQMMAKAGVAAGGRYVRDAIQRGLDAVNNEYFDRGYVNVAVGPVDEKLSADGATVAMTVTIAEGDQFRLGELTFAGNLVGTPREYAAKFGVKKGQIFSRGKLAEGLERLRAFHAEKGQPNVNIIPVTEVDGKKKIKVTIQVVGPGQGGPAAGQGQPRPAPTGQRPAQPAPSAQPQPAPPATMTQPPPAAQPAPPATKP